MAHEHPRFGRAPAAGRRRRLTSGQATTEYALVFAAFLSVVLALGAVWAATRDGGLAGRAVEAASHVLDGDFVSSLKDVLLF